MPAEWEKHEATWFSWPHNKDTWEAKYKYPAMIKVFCQIIKVLSAYEKININVAGIELETIAKLKLQQNGVIDFENIHFHYFATNDAWCRDYGPIFVKNQNGHKCLLNWEYNSWGGKYPPFDLDNNIPTQIATLKSLPIYTPEIVLEGGSIEVNGKGTLLTTKSCLLNPNRNPTLSKIQIEEYLESYLGVTNILWLNDGIAGDDTDGHIDDLSRFVNETTIVTVVESNQADINYKVLKENFELLQTLKDQDGNYFTIVELPMPAPVIIDGQRLPASYANFLIANGVVIVPIFDDPNDQKALDILQTQFNDRKVVGINCRDLVWGLGTIHCLSQQEPA